MDVRNYALVTAAYWGFTLTDGALRMLVLLHFHTLGYSPLQIAFLFLFYEFFGIVTNLIGGWIGAHMGLKVTLFSGLALQVFALGMLALLDPQWPVALAVAYVMGAQALSGIAKDLTKMSSKSAIKLVVPGDAQGALFKWVAVLTGSKNALKGVGFFLGGLLLAWLGFANALWAMAFSLAIVLVLSVVSLPGDMGRAKRKVKFTRILSKSREINLLSTARFFLFGARDVWFVVGLPVFLYSTLGWSFSQVGGFMALWVIGYGIVQGAAPRLLRGHVPSGHTAALAAAVLAATPFGIAWGLAAELEPTLLIVGGLALFGLLFAVNSAVHSFLILSYSDHDKVALNVGFYYMANAAGRLAGTLLSGWIFQTHGLLGCLIASGVMLAAAAAISLLLPGNRILPATPAP